MSSFSFVAHGVPVPQGSARAFNNRVVASNAARLKPWRDTLASAALDASLLADLGPFREPVIVRACFYFARPKHHFGTGKNAEKLRNNAALFPVGRGHGDLDKHCRALGDALVDAAVLPDDALIAKWVCEKRWAAPGELMSTPGAVVHVSPYTSTACPSMPPRTDAP